MRCIGCAKSVSITSLHEEGVILLLSHTEVGYHEGHAFEAGYQEGPSTDAFNIVCLLGIRGSSHERPVRKRVKARTKWVWFVVANFELVLLRHGI